MKKLIILLSLVLLLSGCGMSEEEILLFDEYTTRLKTIEKGMTYAKVVEIIEGDYVVTSTYDGEKERKQIGVFESGDGCEIIMEVDFYNGLVEKIYFESYLSTDQEVER